MRLEPGDIVEIVTPDGFAYVQVTHKHPSYPEVVRALSGLHQTRPAGMDKIADLQTSFVAMLPLGGAIEQGRIPASRIGTSEVPSNYKTFPTFRMPIRNHQGDVVYWWLWDGEGLKPAGELDDCQTSLPLREVMPVEAFLKRLTERA